MTQEALKLALDALELSAVTVDSFGVQKKTNEAITAIKEALAQTQEPVAMLFGSLPVYDRTTPPQRTWVGLDHQDKKKFSSWLDHKTDDEVFTAIDDLLREMNT